MRLKAPNPHDVDTVSSEIDVLQRFYRQKIERVLNELEMLVRQWHDRTGSPSVTHAKEHLRVLRDCYLSNFLSTPALDVLLQHLLALEPVLALKTNEAFGSAS